MLCRVLCVVFVVSCMLTFVFFVCFLGCVFVLVVRCLLLIVVRCLLLVVCFFPCSVLLVVCSPLVVFVVCVLFGHSSLLVVLCCWFAICWLLFVVVRCLLFDAFRVPFFVVWSMVFVI